MSYGAMVYSYKYNKPYLMTKYSNKAIITIVGHGMDIKMTFFMANI